MSGKQPIERIPPIAPVPSLLTSSRPLPDVDWHSGVAWTPVACGHESHNWQQCPELVFVTDGEVSGYVAPEKDIADGMGAPVATDPFLIYTGVECEYVLTEGGDRLVTAMTEINEAHTPGQLARALWMGDGLTSTNPNALYGYPPSLRRVATDISASIGGSAPLDDAVAALLEAYELCTFGLGGAVIHMPSVLVTTALGGGDGARVCWPEGSLYRGPLGSVVSPGPGYPHGASAAGADGYGPLSNVDADGSLWTNDALYQGNGYDEVWMYISGPIEYALKDVDVVGSVAERNAPRRQNKTVVLAERAAILRFDPCCVFATRVDNPAGEVS